MKRKMFSVRDQKVGAYLDPVFLRSAGEAVRSFSDSVNAEGHQFGRHAEDYTMWYIGDFDQDTGVVEPAQIHECVAKAVDLLVVPDIPQGRMGVAN